MNRTKWIMKFVIMHKWTFLASIIVVSVMTMINLSYPFLNGEIVNTVIYEKDFDHFFTLCFIYICILVVNQFIIATLNSLISTHLRTSFVFDIKRALFNKVLNMKAEKLSSIYVGDLVSRINNDTNDFMDLVFNGIIWGFSNFLHISFSVIFMFYYNIWLGVLTVVLVPVVYLVSNFYKKWSKNVSFKFEKKQGELSSLLFEIIIYLKEIKLLGIFKNMRNYYLKGTIINSDGFIKNEKIKVISEISNSFISLIAQLTIYIVCSIFIVNGKMTIGTFVAAISYYNMASTYFMAINNRIVQSGKQNVSILRVVDILNNDDEKINEDSKNSEIAINSIEFRNVGYSYNKSEKILTNINFHIKKGSTIGIVGKSGEGKSTIANLLCRLYETDSGEILLNEININEYNLNWLRDQIGMVEQDFVIYNDTLRYNLSFSNDKSDDNRLIEAIKQSAFYEDYKSLTNGLDTVLGKFGHNLSIGQKQRVAIARTIVKRPQILILDEATSALDSENESIIKKVLLEKSKNQIKIIISHRFSTIENCDKILLISDGVVKGYDTHSNLMQNNIIYKDLAMKQYVKGGKNDKNKSIQNSN